MKLTYLFICVSLIFTRAVAGDVVIFDGSDPSMLDFPPVANIEGVPANLSLFPPNKGPSNNQITVTGGNIPGFVFGGGSDTAANVTNNKVIINGGVINQGVYGGWTEGNANYNSVTVNSGNIQTVIKGGYGVDAVGNSVIINGGTVTGTTGGVYGGWGLAGVLGVVQNNTITINGGYIQREIVGGYNWDGDVSYNTININGGVMAETGNINGGISTKPGTAVSDNTINISGGTIGMIGSPNGSVYGGTSTLGFVMNNTINLSGGTIYGLVAGTGSSNNPWQSAGNNLVVNGGQVNVGSIARFQNATITNSGNINVIGSPWGGILGYYAVFNDLHNDGILSFYNIPYDGAATGITGFNQNSAEIQGVYTGSGAIGLDAYINPGAATSDADRIVFNNAPGVRVRLAVLPSAGSIQAPNNPVRVATINTGATDGAFTTTEAGFGIFAYDIVRTGPDYFLVINDQYTEELGFVYSEASAAALAQLSRSPDLLHRNVLNNCVRKNGEGGVTVFGDIAYSKERIKVGSHVDIDGTDGLVAFSYNCGADLSFGVFGEFFYGDYETTNISTTNLDSFVIKSEGDLKTAGGGVFVQYRPERFRKDSDHFPEGGLRLEASVRTGVSSLDFSDSTLEDTHFKKRNNYWGATVVAAYVLALSEKSKMALFSQGIWTHQDQKKVTDGIGQQIDFNGAHSLRILAGTRLDFSIWNNVQPFVGLAVNWETSGKPEVNINGYKAKTAKLTGVSGVAELGLSAALTRQANVDLKGTGMFGKRDGLLKGIWRSAAKDLCWRCAVF